MLEAKVALGELCEAAGSSALDGRGALVLAQLERFHQLIVLLRIEEALARHRAQISASLSGKDGFLATTLSELRTKAFKEAK